MTVFSTVGSAIKWILTNSPGVDLVNSLPSLLISESTLQVYSVTARGLGQDPSRCVESIVQFENVSAVIRSLIIKRFINVQQDFNLYLILSLTGN